MNLLFSIIIPVFNSGEFLSLCLDSILRQSFHDFELIIVDDGSSDDSLDIARSYAGKDSRIKLYARSNGGVSSARNFGLQNASGDYVIFVDSDDEVSPLLLMVLDHAIKGRHSDVFHFYHKPNASFDKAIWEENLLPSEWSCNDSLRPLNSDYVLDYVTKGSGTPYVWDKVYLRSFLIRNKIFFSNGLGEDYRFNLDVFSRLPKIDLIEIHLYAYRISEGSLSRRFDLSEFDQLSVVLLAKLNALRIIGESPEAYREVVSSWYWTSYRNIFVKSVLSGKSMVHYELPVSIDDYLLPPPLWLSSIQRFPLLRRIMWLYIRTRTLIKK